MCINDFSVLIICAVHGAPTVPSVRPSNVMHHVDGVKTPLTTDLLNAMDAADILMMLSANERNAHLTRRDTAVSVLIHCCGMVAQMSDVATTCIYLCTTMYNQSWQAMLNNPNVLDQLSSVCRRVAGHRGYSARSDARTQIERPLRIAKHVEWSGDSEKYDASRRSRSNVPVSEWMCWCVCAE
jgi:hypothetical protein